MTSDLASATGVHRLTDYLEGTLAVTDRSAIDQHLEGCPRCVAFVRSYVEIPRILRLVTASAMTSDSRVALRRFLTGRSS